MKTIDSRNYLTDEGKVFIHKDTKNIMGWGICLGENDTIDNYDEADCPEEYKGNEDYDNTVNDIDIKPYKLIK
jgi:hypothetical protein